MSTILSLISLVGASIKHRLAPNDSRPTDAGAAVYNPLFLNLVYDRLVLGAYCSYVWRCPASTIKALYARVLSDVDNERGRRILDVGVGTGHFLATAPLAADAKVTLFDLNSACLDAASRRCREAHHGRVPGLEVDTVCGDFLAGRDEPVSIHQKLPPQGFDVIFTSMLLHCVPGPPRRKATALASLASLLEPGNGVLAGVTVLGPGGSGADEVRHNLLGRFLMFWHNALGMFDNQGDNAVALVSALSETFHDVKWEVVGTALVFEARRPKA